jgi:hypothetical protein
MEEYNEMIKFFIKNDSKFYDALEIAKLNSLGGEIWVVGSFLYKNILKEKYGLENLNVKDYDFMLENQKNYLETIVPFGWKNVPTYYGGPDFLEKKFKWMFTP